jgi:hypothetical protein
MTRRAATQGEITRAIKAAKVAGLAICRVEVDGTKIVVLTAESGVMARDPTSADDLDRELEEWESKRRGHH